MVSRTSAEGPEEQRDAALVVLGGLDADLGAQLARWSPRAACRGQGTAVFFGRAHHGRAAAMCSGCAVAEACLWWAMAVEEDAGHRFGIWGGTTPALRARIGHVAGPGYGRGRLRVALSALSEVDPDSQAPGGEAA
ncbi:MAG: WhiB family transcriptional regulator [Acidimicrobiales bacterium]